MSERGYHHLHQIQTEPNNYGVMCSSQALDHDKIPSNNAPSLVFSPKQQIPNTNSRTHFQFMGNNSHVQSWKHPRQHIKNFKCPSGNTSASLISRSSFVCVSSRVQLNKQSSSLNYRKSQATMLGFEQLLKSQPMCIASALPAPAGFSLPYLVSNSSLHSHGVMIY